MTGVIDKVKNALQAEKNTPEATAANHGHNEYGGDKDATGHGPGLPTGLIGGHKHSHLPDTEHSERPAVSATNPGILESTKPGIHGERDSGTGITPGFENHPSTVPPPLHDDTTGAVPPLHDDDDHDKKKHAEEAAVGAGAAGVAAHEHDKHGHEKHHEETHGDKPKEKKEGLVAGLLHKFHKDHDKDKETDQSKGDHHHLVKDQGPGTIPAVAGAAGTAEPQPEKHHHEKEKEAGAVGATALGTAGVAEHEHDKHKHEPTTQGAAPAGTTGQQLDKKLVNDAPLTATGTGTAAPATAAQPHDEQLQRDAPLAAAGAGTAGVGTALVAEHEKHEHAPAPQSTAPSAVSGQPPVGQPSHDAPLIAAEPVTTPATTAGQPHDAKTGQDSKLAAAEAGTAGLGVGALGVAEHEKHKPAQEPLAQDPVGQPPAQVPASQHESAQAPVAQPQPPVPERQTAPSDQSHLQTKEARVAAEAGLAGAAGGAGVGLAEHEKHAHDKPLDQVQQQPPTTNTTSTGPYTEPSVAGTAPISRPPKDSELESVPQTHQDTAVPQIGPASSSAGPDPSAVPLPASGIVQPEDHKPHIDQHQHNDLYDKEKDAATAAAHSTTAVGNIPAPAAGAAGASATQTTDAIKPDDLGAYQKPLVGEHHGKPEPSSGAGAVTGGATTDTQPLPIGGSTLGGGEPNKPIDLRGGDTFGQHHLSGSQNFPVADTPHTTGPDPATAATGAGADSGNTHASAPTAGELNNTGVPGPAPAVMAAKAAAGFDPAAPAGVTGTAENAS